mgnify:CR=1 FL=1
MRRSRRPCLPAVAVPTALAALVCASCSSTQLAGGALRVVEPTRDTNHVTLTWTVGLTMRVDGMQVQTVGEDTVVTRLDDNRARRFILRGLSEYTGQIYLSAVDLVVGGTSVWIDEESFKAHGPAGSVDVALEDDDGEDRFGGKDLVFADGVLTAVGER